MNQKKKNSQGKSKQLIIILGVTMMVAGAFFITKNISNNQEVSSNSENVAKSQLSESGDLIIPIADVTEKANFYSYDIDGTQLEIIAIKAPDGSIRTAFNTCQVCYSSGRGYYEQEGDKLVCQNCGNTFTASDVEVAKGGCNPVPISSEYKTVDETNIVIPKDFLESAKVIFENWKS